MKNNIFWKLLVELKELCEKNGIEYWLGGAILRYTDAISEEMRELVSEMPDDFGDMELIMDGANAKKLLELSNQLPAGRILESVKTNPLFRNLDIYYIDTESTCVDFMCLDRRTSWGAFIPIRIMQPNYKSGIKQTINVKTEKMWRICYSYHHYVTSVTSNEERIYGPVQRFSKGKRTTRIAFNYMLSTSFKPEYKSVSIYKRRGRKRVNAIHFATKRMLLIDGIEFMTVSDAEGYLERMYGKNWATVNLSEPSRYVEENKSYDNLAKQLYENDTFWKTIATQRGIYQSNRTKNTVYESNWEMAKSIFAGITLQDKLIEYKPLMYKMQREGDHIGVLDIMQAYPKKVLKMNELYGVDIDSELADIYRQSMKALEN